MFFRCLSLCAFWLLLVANVQASTFRIDAGTLDLRSWDIESQPVIPLKGQAEFHWSRFISSDGPAETPAQIAIPGGWNVVDSYPVEGYASYRIRILVREIQPLSFHFSPLWSASRIYVDDVLVHTAGQPGRNAEAEDSDLGDFREYTFTPRSQAFDLIFEVSNHALFQGGMAESSYLGQPRAIQRKIYRVLGWSAFLIGTLIIMAFYHFGLYFLRRSDRSTLYYGLLCLGVAIHMIVGDPSGLISLFATLPFHARVLVYNLGWGLAVVAFMHYCALLFPRDYSLLTTRVIAILSLGYSISLCFMEIHEIIKMSAYFQIISLFASAYSIFTIGIAVLRKRESAPIFLASIVILVSCVLHDMYFRRGFISEVPLVGLGLFVFTFCQSYMLSARFSKAFRLAETSEAEVRNLNQNLEQRVDEQTREIKSILQNIKLGIFTISGAQYPIIGKDYSKHLEELVNRKELAGMEALPLLLESSQLTREVRHQVESVLCASFGEESINFEMNEDIFPRQIFWQHPELGERIYDLTWNPITTDQDKIEKVLVTIGDVTNLKIMEKQTRVLQSEFDIVAEILNVRDEDFRRFIKISRSFLDQNHKLVSHADPNVRDAEALKIIFMNLHTLKGVARSLNFRQLSDLIHTMEQYYSQLAKQEGNNWDPDLIKRDMHELTQRITEYEAVAQHKLGRFLDDTARLVMPLPKALSSFAALSTLRHAAEPELASEVDPLFEALQKTLFVPLRDTLEDIFRNTRALAKDLEKPEPTVILDIPGYQISTATEEALRNSFLHLLRNAMDHGIEKPEVRLLAGKAPAGLIHLQMEAREQSMRLTLRDDGRGLDVVRLKNLGEAQVDANWNSIAQLIFHSGVSTARTITSISGRGVGMPAVAKFMADIGGRMEIMLLADHPNSQGCIPFQMLIELPIQLFHSHTGQSLQGAA